MCIVDIDVGIRFKDAQPLFWFGIFYFVPIDTETDLVLFDQSGLQKYRFDFFYISVYPLFINEAHLLAYFLDNYRL